MSFLPPNYTSPKTTNHYMKLLDGENRIRILSKPIIGWEHWIDKKPIRYQFNEKPKLEDDSLSPIRHFWAFIVYNYAEKEVQILNITQASIRKSIENLCKDEDWGDPFSYDIKICRKGEGVNTEYSVNPSPHKEIDPKIVKEFRDNPCKLEALFINEDPFSKEWSSYTPFCLDEKENKIIEIPKISAEQSRELETIFCQCDPLYLEKVWKTLKKPPISIESLEQLPANLFERIRTAALKNKEEYEASQEDLFEDEEVSIEETLEAQEM